MAAEQEKIDISFNNNQPNKIQLKREILDTNQRFDSGRNVSNEVNDLNYTNVNGGDELISDNGSGFTFEDDTCISNNKWNDFKKDISKLFDLKQHTEYLKAGDCFVKDSSSNIGSRLGDTNVHRDKAMAANTSQLSCMDKNAHSNEKMETPITKACPFEPLKLKIQPVKKLVPEHFLHRNSKLLRSESLNDHPSGFISQRKVQELLSTVEEKCVEKVHTVIMCYEDRIKKLEEEFQTVQTQNISSVPRDIVNQNGDVDSGCYGNESLEDMPSIKLKPTLSALTEAENNVLVLRDENTHLKEKQLELESHNETINQDNELLKQKCVAMETKINELETKVSNIAMDYEFMSVLHEMALEKLKLFENGCFMRSPRNSKCLDEPIMNVLASRRKPPPMYRLNSNSDNPVDMQIEAVPNGLAPKRGSFQDRCSFSTDADEPVIFEDFETEDSEIGSSLMPPSITRRRVSKLSSGSYDSDESAPELEIWTRRDNSSRRESSKSDTSADSLLRKSITWESTRMLSFLPGLSGLRSHSMSGSRGSVKNSTENIVKVDTGDHSASGEHGKDHGKNPALHRSKSSVSSFAGLRNRRNGLTDNMAALEVNRHKVKKFAKKHSKSDLKSMFPTAK